MNNDASSIPTDSTPPSPPPPPPKLLRRDADGRVGGVAGGLGRYFGIDPNIVRVAFVLAAFLGLFGVGIYAILWAVLPTTESSDQRPIAITDNPWRMAIGIGVALLVMGTNFRTNGFEMSLSVFSLVPLALIGLGIYLLNERNKESVQPPRPNRPESTLDSPEPRWGTPLIDTVAPDAVTDYPVTDHPAADEPTAKSNRFPVGTYTFVAALIGAAIVGLVDVAGASLGAGAYFLTFTIVATVGFVTALVLGHIWGPIAMILIGLAGLFWAPAIDVTIESGGGESSIAVDPGVVPASRYSLGVGELEVDLTDALIEDDMTIELEVGAGRLVVIVPDNVDVRVDADARMGALNIMGRTSEGWRVSADRYVEAQSSQPGDATLTLNIDVTIGEAVVRS